MHRIDTKTAQKDKFGAGKNGFTSGNPQTGTPATDLDDDYFDMLQEELCSVVEASGASLEKARHDQLLTALRALLLSRKNPFGDIKSDGTVKTALENLGLGEGSALPVGVPVPWPSATPPTGWLKCNGAAFSAEEYPELAKAYPTNKLPDLRGEFIRGWDDGRGIDAVTPPLIATSLLIRVRSASSTNSLVFKVMLSAASMTIDLMPLTYQRPVAGSYSNQPPSGCSATQASADVDGGAN